MPSTHYKEISQYNVTEPITFLMILSSDHITGATGKTPSVTISKGATAFAAPAGAVTEVGNGVYAIAANAADADTLGPLWIHATASGCDPCDEQFEVVYDVVSATAIQSPSSSSSVVVTGLDLIKRAMKRLGVLEAGEEPSSEDATDGLECLNDLLDSLNAEHLMIPCIQRTLFPLTASVQTYSVGAGGDFDMPWPNGLEGAGISWTTGTTTMEWLIANLTQQQWRLISLKGQTSPWPRGVYYERTHPLGLANVWPIPDGTQDVQLVVYAKTPLSEFANLTTQYTFQPAYRRMLRDNLAQDWASYFNVTVSDDLRVAARTSKAAVKSSNQQLTEMAVLTPFSTGGFYDINNDSY